jgi:hypothetical protein
VEDTKKEEKDTTDKPEGPSGEKPAKDDKKTTKKPTFKPAYKAAAKPAKKPTEKPAKKPAEKPGKTPTKKPAAEEEEEEEIPVCKKVAMLQTSACPQNIANPTKRQLWTVYEACSA